MAAKIVIFALTAFVAIQLQGLSASGLQQRSLRDDLEAAAKAAEEKVKAAFQAEVNKTLTFINNGKIYAQEAVAKVSSVINEIAAKAKEVIANAKQNLSNLAQEAEEKISSYVKQLEKFGEGARECASSNQDNIKTLISATETKVQSCATGVQEKVIPLVKNVTEAAQKLKDLGATAANVAATCAAAGTNWLTALACYPLKIATVLKDAAADIAIIAQDVPQIIELAPQAKQEVEDCAADVKTTVSEVNELLEEISACVKNYTSSAA